jgi:hypothetical protein
MVYNTELPGFWTFSIVRYLVIFFFALVLMHLGLLVMFVAQIPPPPFLS